MNRFTKKTIGIVLSLIMIVSYFPAGLVWAVDDVSEQNNNEATDLSVASPVDNQDMPEEAEQVSEETSTEAEPETDINLNEEEVLVEEKSLTSDSLMEKSEITVNEEENDDTVYAAKITVDENVTNGSIELTEEADGRITGTATPGKSFDLATVRQLWTDSEGNQQEQYLEYTKEDGIYYFEADTTHEESVITAYFYSLVKWDGAVDLTWYDPDETEFKIGTPAQLAGLAAITNGMVDENVTAEYMIKDNEGRTLEDGEYLHRYISTEPAIVDLLTPNASEGAGQVRDTAWRLPEVEHYQVGGASDDIHNDFLYRTVKLTADLDMGDVNWTPIGGKYAMNRDADSGIEAKVIDTRFQGVFDGQGHTVTINCDRVAKMGFAYAMEIALFGYLGGGVDYKNGYPKDTYMDYENYWIPTVRNVVVKGDVKGRRMVAGVVGRTGETNYGVLVENCVNYASVYATDMRGCAGIVGAAWGKAAIRNCYNAGTIHSTYWEHGGIVGSNGYEGSEGREPGGADIYNCYNYGETAKYDQASSSWLYDGQEIGVDGEAFASYKVANCYYEVPEAAIEDKSGYSVGSTSKNKRARVTNVVAADLKSDEVLTALNANGDAFCADTDNINNGYPVLFFQTAQSSTASANVTLMSNDESMGSLTSPDSLTDVPYGSNIDLTATAAKGYKLSYYIISDGESEREVTTGNHVCVTGKDLTVTAVFTERTATPIYFAEEADGEDYYITVTKIYDGNLEQECSVHVSSGAEMNYNDRIKLTPVMKPLDTVHPDIKNLEYTGKFGDPVFTENSLEKVANRTGIYSVTGETDVIELSYKPKTQGKRWTTVADTSWYKSGTKVFTLTTARQLAGLAALCEDGTDFTGVTIKLGSDIGFENTIENSGDEYGYERSWIGIGNDAHPFTGTFDGQGHTVRYLHRNFAYGYSDGSNGGLFGVTEGAKIANVTVESGSYLNDYNVEMECGFINGANGGGIVGDAIDTVIENCTASVTMDKAFNSGGIAGEIEGSTTVRGCVSNCNITGTGESIGGIAGILGSSSGAAITSCINNGSITSTKWKIGGILGNGNTYKADITKCINNGSITTEMKGTSSYVHAAGGIVGYAGGLVTCSQCVNTGDITGKLQTYAIGGIAGTLLRGTITDCYNTGKIYSESTSKYAQVSGIVNLGTNKSNIANVTNCYNAGAVTISDEFAGTAVGGVIGYGNAEVNSISNVYCTDLAAAGIEGKAGIAGEVVAAEELKGYAPKLGSAFVRDLDGINDGYPVLVWQDPDLVGTVAISSIKKNSDTILTPSWKKTGAGDGVELYRSTSATSGFSKIYSGTATSYKNSKLTYGKTYYYKARVYRKVDGKTYYGAWSAVKYYRLIPAKPTLSSVKNTKAKKAVVKWKKVSGAAGYEIYRSTKKNSGFKKVATIKKGKTVKWTNTKLKKGKTYYYKVRAYKTVNKKKGYSDFSAVKGVKIKK